MAGQGNAGGFIGGVGQNIAANVCGGAIGATCVSLGLAGSADLNSLDSWPSWFVVIGSLTTLVFGGNAVRLVTRWWRQRRIGKADPGRFGLLVASLAGDAPHAPMRREVVATIERELGTAVDIVSWPDVVIPPDGRQSDSLDKVLRDARKLLERTGCDLLIWGHVKGNQSIELRFVSRDAIADAGRSYGLLSSNLQLPQLFSSDVGVNLAARVAAEMAAAEKVTEVFGSPDKPGKMELLERVRARVEPLLLRVDRAARNDITRSYIDVFLASLWANRISPPDQRTVIRALQDLDLSMRSVHRNRMESAILRARSMALLGHLAFEVDGGEAMVEKEKYYRAALDDLNACDWTEHEVRREWHHLLDEYGTSIIGLTNWFDIIASNPQIAGTPEAVYRWKARAKPDLAAGIAALEALLAYLRLNYTENYWKQVWYPNILINLGNGRCFRAAELRDLNLAKSAVAAFDEVDLLRTSLPWIYQRPTLVERYHEAVQLVADLTP